MGKSKAKFKESDIIRIYNKISFGSVTYHYSLVSQIDDLGYYLIPLTNCNEKYVAHEYCEKYYEKAA